VELFRVTNEIALGHCLPPRGILASDGQPPAQEKRAGWDARPVIMKS
jgi:hypothetical protein